jgi:hypothetical protein
MILVFHRQKAKRKIPHPCFHPNAQARAGDPGSGAGDTVM